ncbi:MAG: hypothetical protein ABI406_18690 [Ktedonobacteraceae bacterium]
MATTQKSKYPTRHFSRTEVEAFFEKYWGPGFRKSYDEVTVISTAILEGLNPPAWSMQIELVNKNAVDLLLYRSYLTYIFYEEKEPSGMVHLNIVHEIKLPEGCWNVQAENEAMDTRSSIK